VTYTDEGDDVVVVVSELPRFGERLYVGGVLVAERLGHHYMKLKHGLGSHGGEDGSPVGEAAYSLPPVSSMFDSTDLVPQTGKLTGPETWGSLSERAVSNGLLRSSRTEHGLTVGLPL